MAQKLVSVALNQQQLELIDNTIARGTAADRAELFRKALKEYSTAHRPASTPSDRLSGKDGAQ